MKTLIENNLDLSLKDLIDKDPKVLDLTFGEISKYSGLANKYNYYEIELDEEFLISKFNVKDIKPYVSNIIIALNGEKNTTVLKALEFFNSDAQISESLLELTPRLIQIGCDLEFIEPEISDSEKLLKYILTGICNEGLDYYLRDYTSPANIQEYHKLKVPFNIVKAWDNYIKASVEFCKSLKEIGLTKEDVLDMGWDPDELGF